eukprot:494795-Pyramimonas_sp.AAC.1
MRVSPRPALGYLWDHRVQAEALFPGAGYLETAVTCVGTLLAGNGPPPALRRVHIPAPCMMPSPQAGGRSVAPRGVTLSCTVTMQQ